GRSIQSKRLVADAALMLPNILKLIGRLLLDPRVPRRAKITLGVAAAYVVSPIDLVPDVIPVIGWADDVLLVLFAIDSLIERAGPEIVDEHWDGPGDLLSLVREAVGLSRSIMPKRLTAIIDRLSG
ncbi:MAG: YkvA family protein, partial [Acidimicrobiia bacterium]